MGMGYVAGVATVVIMGVAVTYYKDSTVQPREHFDKQFEQRVRTVSLMVASHITTAAGSATGSAAGIGFTTAAAAAASATMAVATNAATKEITGVDIIPFLGSKWVGTISAARGRMRRTETSLCAGANSLRPQSKCGPNGMQHLGLYLNNLLLDRQAPRVLARMSLYPIGVQLCSSLSYRCERVNKYEIGGQVDICSAAEKELKVQRLVPSQSWTRSLNLSVSANPSKRSPVMCE